MVSTPPNPQTPAGRTVLVTGAGGRLGGRLAALLGSRFRAVAGIHRAPAPPGIPFQPLELLDLRSVETALEATGARAVVHCAALADADACERDRNAAHRLNVTASEA